MPTLFRLLSRLPLSLLQAAGAWLGLLVWAASPTYRRRLRANLAQAGWTNRALERAAAREAGRALGELPFVWYASGARAAVHRVTVHGRECVDAARRDGHGLLYLTPHLGCFEVSAQIAALWGPITVLYRPPRKAWLASLAPARLRHQLSTAPATVSGMRPLLRALRAGEAVGLLPDQAPAAGEGVWAPFFGRPAYTMTLPGRLVELTGARVVLAFAERLPGGRGWDLHLRPLDVALSTDPTEAAAAVNRAIEDLVRLRPEQYLWGYNRYKTPAGAPPAPEHLA